MKKDKIINIFIILPIIWIFTGLLTINNGDKILLVMTIISSLISIISYSKDCLFNIKNNNYILVLLCLFIISLMFDMTNTFSPIILKAIISVLLIVIFTPIKLINKNLFIIATTLGSIVTLCYTLYFVVYLNLPRELWPINAIPFSTIVCIINIIALSLILSSKNKYITIISGLNFTISIISILLSETRGTILAIVLTIIFLFVLSNRNYKFDFNKIKVWSIITVSITLMIYPIIKDRVYNHTIGEISSITSGNENTSIGIRLNLWKAGVYIIDENPIFGVQNHFQPTLDKLAKTDVITHSSANFKPSHFHNQYIDLAVKWGIPSLIIFLLIIIIPLKYLNKNNLFGYLSFYGINSIILLAGLTDPPLVNKEIFILFFTAQGLLYSYCKNH
ncbi:TPA: O-antigen ligase family protein [Photobacterium damselae]